MSDIESGRLNETAVAAVALEFCARAIADHQMAYRIDDLSTSVNLRFPEGSTVDGDDYLSLGTLRSDTSNDPWGEGGAPVLFVQDVADINQGRRTSEKCAKYWNASDAASLVRIVDSFTSRASGALPEGFQVDTETVRQALPVLKDKAPAFAQALKARLGS